jgi:Vitamin K-dependent gamma-carboxylase
MATVIAVRSAPATCVQWWVRPFAIFGADLRPNLVLMAKVIVFAILLQSQLPLSSHFLPFLPIFDSMGSPVVFHRVLVLAFFAGCAALFFTRQASAAAGVLGVTILVSILASRPFFSNNLTYCGALLFLIGLQPANRENRLLRLQVVLLYFAAGLNKLLDPDWRSGQFFEYWFGHVHVHDWYLKMAGWLPQLLLSKLMSWVSFSTELGLSFMLLFRRLYPLAIWIGLAFHTFMLVLSNTTFHLFFYATCAAYLAFVTWPQERLTVFYNSESSFCAKARTFLENIDLEQRSRWVPWTESRRSGNNPELPWSICLNVGERRYNGFVALKMLLLYNPLTYLGLVAALRIPDVLHLRRWIAATALLLFSPLINSLGERLFRTLARRPVLLRAPAAAGPRWK